MQSHLPLNTGIIFFDPVYPLHGFVPVAVSNVSQVWEESFRNTLFIRPRTQHTKCSECIRHKLVLKRLKRNVAARRSQLEMFKAHLRRQYQDRVVYWKNRSESRTGELPSSVRKVTVTIDSIDHQKFPLPKSLSMNSKDFSGFIRPTLSVTCQLIHGFCVLFYVSGPWVRHDSSWTAELLAHGLHTMQQQFPSVDLRSSHYATHGDNSSKELKNNCCLQLLSSLVGMHRLKYSSLSCLQSGHSHEDIDQLFSGLAQWIGNSNEIHTADEYVAAIQAWLDKPSTRPTESYKKVFLVDCNRAWPLR